MNIKFRYVVFSDVIMILVLLLYHANSTWLVTLYLGLSVILWVAGTAGLLLQPSAVAVVEVLTKYKQQKLYIVYDIGTDIAYLYLMMRASLALLFIIYTFNICVKYWIYTVNWRKA